MTFILMASRPARGLAMALVAFPLAAQAPAAPMVLTLGGAARLAAEQSAGPEAARSRVDQAEARVRQRRAEFLPSISGALSDGERTFNSASFGISFRDPLTGRALFDPNGEVLGPVRTWDVRGTLRQSIADFSSLERLRAARANVVASRADQSATAQQAAAAAAVTYVRTLRADAQLAARVADSTLAEELVGIARDQLTAGVGIALDVTRARSQLAATRAQLIAARNERDRAHLELHRALGVPLGTGVTLADSLGSLPTRGELPSEQDATDRAMRARGDLRAADEQLAAAERQISAIRAERLPALSAFADQGSTGKGTDHLLSTYTWGLQVSVPVFDGFRREGRLDEQRSAVRELDVRRRDLAQQAAIEVRAALLDLESAREQLSASAERLALAEQELAEARDRFTAGVAGNADVITASLGLNAARTQMVDARASLQSSRVALARSQGLVTELP
ncbi:MAG: TolC family protein [Gemmatimonadales bacterium]